MIPTAPGILEILVQASEGRRARPPATSTGPGSRRCVPQVFFFFFITIEPRNE